MRLGIQLLDTSTALNRIHKIDQLKFGQGETIDLFFQLMDLDQNIRYMPATGATVFVEVARLPEAFGTILNQREIKDFSVRRYADAAFSEDRSVWKLSLVVSETSKMMSSNIRVTVTEGSKISIALLSQAIQVFRSEV